MFNGFPIKNKKIAFASFFLNMDDYRLCVRVGCSGCCARGQGSRYKPLGLGVEVVQLADRVGKQSCGVPLEALFVFAAHTYASLFSVLRSPATTAAKRLVYFRTNNDTCLPQLCQLLYLFSVSKVIFKFTLALPSFTSVKCKTLFPEGNLQEQNPYRVPLTVFQFYCVL